MNEAGNEHVRLAGRFMTSSRRRTLANRMGTLSFAVCLAALVSAALLIANVDRRKHRTPRRPCRKRKQCSRSESSTEQQSLDMQAVFTNADSSAAACGAAALSGSPKTARSAISRCWDRRSARALGRIAWGWHPHHVHPISAVVTDAGVSVGSAVPVQAGGSGPRSIPAVALGPHPAHALLPAQQASRQHQLPQRPSHPHAPVIQGLIAAVSAAAATGEQPAIMMQAGAVGDAAAGGCPAPEQLPFVPGWTAPLPPHPAALDRTGCTLVTTRRQLLALAKHLDQVPSNVAQLQSMCFTCGRGTHAFCVLDGTGALTCCQAPTPAV
jgi:hypothetical protein